MEQLFEILACFHDSGTVSEDNYHDVVRCIRAVRSHINDDHELERLMRIEIEKRGWPQRYNPFELDSSIRFGTVFEHVHHKTQIDDMVTSLLTRLKPA